jgi:hypothetical protein
VGALIDSSVFMAAERGLCDLEAELTKRLGDWVGMAAITASEMLAGVAWPNRSPNKRQASEIFVEGVLASRIRDRARERTSRSCCFRRPSNVCWRASVAHVTPTSSS